MSGINQGGLLNPSTAYKPFQYPWAMLADEEHEGCGDGGAGAALLLHSPCSAT